MKRHKLLEEITALHSRSTAVSQFLLCLRSEDNENVPQFSIWSQTIRQWEAPVDWIRDYYGDEIAIYFEWMNFFLSWIIVPGLTGVLIKGINILFYEELSTVEDSSHSPFNAVFSIIMTFWGSLFIIYWKRH